MATRATEPGTFVDGVAGVGPFITAGDLNTLPGGWVVRDREHSNTVVSSTTLILDNSFYARPDRSYLCTFTNSTITYSAAGGRLDYRIRYAVPNTGTLTTIALKPGETGVSAGASVAGIDLHAEFNTDALSSSGFVRVVVQLDHNGGGSSTLVSLTNVHPTLVVQDIGQT